MLAVYNDVADAARSVSAITAAGIVPATLEMMDAPAIRAIEASKPSGYPLDAAAVLIEVDGPAAGSEKQAGRIRENCTDHGCREVRAARSRGTRATLGRPARRLRAVARLAPNYLVADCTVPRTLLPEALAKVAEIVKRYGSVTPTSSTPVTETSTPDLFDSRDPEQLKRVHQAGREIMQACVAWAERFRANTASASKKWKPWNGVFGCRHRRPALAPGS